MKTTNEKKNTLNWVRKIVPRATLLEQNLKGRQGIAREVSWGNVSL
jgi:hypothetical protein